MASLCANRDIDGIKPLTEGIEEEENSEVEKNGDSISQASHLGLGKTIKEIGSNSATFVRRGAGLGILQIFAGPLSYKSSGERTRHAKE